MIKIIELFAGVGSQPQALKNIGVEHEIIGISEIDKYAISSYEQLHGQTHNFGDISKIETLPDVDLWTYSFPCQDLSVAGKGEGIKEGTRSGLLYEVERLLNNSNKPKYLLMENVKNLIGKKHKADFDIWCKKLEELGYTNYYQVLNAKNFKVPQNRERVFMISILGEHKPYVFPKEQELKIRLKDILQNEVDEKFYLSQEIQDRFLKFDKKFNNKNDKIILEGTTGPDKTIGQRDICFSVDGIIGSLMATDYKQPKQILENKILQVGNIVETGNFENPQRGRIYSTDGISPALNCVGGGGLEPKIITDEPIICASRGRDVENPSNRTPSNNKEQRIELNLKGTSNCITTVQKDNLVIYEHRIRKLTPLECWRLMGWKDEQFNKIKGISNSQLYKQAGNGIVVNVLEDIFRSLFCESDKK